MSSLDRTISPAAKPGISECMATVLLRQLERVTTVPLTLREIITNATGRLLDSQMLIEDTLRPFRALPDQLASILLPNVPRLSALEDVISNIEVDGLGPHFHTLMGGFGEALTWLLGSEQQINEAQTWVKYGLRAGFFMTDRGGPSMQKDWISTYTPGDERDQLTIDKIWGIGAMDCGFAMIAARQTGRLAPVLAVVPPDVCAQMQRSIIGLPYLDGALQLGNISGLLTIPHGSTLSGGGSMGIKQYMTLVRPRFVRGLCAHIEWLLRQGRVRVDLEHRESLAFIKFVAVQLCEKNIFTRYSEDQVMALKFAINELILELVKSRSVYSLMDQRDLLGFSKMEGSSYRCFYEIYTRSKGARDAW